MEKLELKLRNMEYFVMKLEGATTEEKLELLAAIGEMKKKIQKFKEGKEVTNVDENVEISDKVLTILPTILDAWKNTPKKKKLNKK